MNGLPAYSRGPVSAGFANAAPSVRHLLCVTLGCASPWPPPPHTPFLHPGARGQSRGGATWPARPG